MKLGNAYRVVGMVMALSASVAQAAPTVTMPITKAIGSTGNGSSGSSNGGADSSSYCRAGGCSTKVYGEPFSCTIPQSGSTIHFGTLSLSYAVVSFLNAHSVCLHQQDVERVKGVCTSAHHEGANGYVIRPYKERYSDVYWNYEIVKAECYDIIALKTFITR